MRSEPWWIQLHKTINDPISINVLQKEAIDQEDKDTLIVLGILEIWALSKHNGSEFHSWSPILKRISECKEAAEAVVEHLVSFATQRECPQDIRDLLVEKLSYLTPSTVWLLKHDTFWKLKTQMQIRIKASLTILDRFQNDIGNLSNFATALKSPSELCDVWLAAVIRTGAPLFWKDLSHKYWEAVIHIKTAAEVK